MAKIICIIDGMTDEQFRIDAYPNLRDLARLGLSGQLETTPRGFLPGTLPCVLTLLGVPPEQIPQKSRGWLEARGLDIPLEEKDLVVRGTWTSLDEEGRLRGMAPGPAPGSLPRFSGLRYYPAAPDKALLVLEGQAPALAKLKTWPPHENWGRPLAELPVTGCPLLEEFLAVCRRPGLALVPWGEAACLELCGPEALAGAAAVTATPIVSGIARQLGMKIVTPKGATGDTDSDLAAKTAAALTLAKEYPLVLLHIGGADEAAHRLLPEEKRAFLARVDREVTGPLAASGCRLLVTSDHGTSPYTGQHLAEAQPFFLYGAGLTPGKTAGKAAAEQEKAGAKAAVAEQKKAGGKAAAAEQKRAGSTSVHCPKASGCSGTFSRNPEDSAGTFVRSPKASDCSGTVARSQKASACCSKTFTHCSKTFAGCPKFGLSLPGTAALSLFENYFPGDED